MICPLPGIAFAGADLLLGRPLNMTRQIGIIHDQVLAIEPLRQCHFIVRLVKTPVTETADVDPSVQCLSIVAFPETITPVQLARDQVVEGEIPGLATQLAMVGG